MRRKAALVLRAVVAAFLALLGLLLAWEAIANAPSWSNGWMEGTSYALGAVALLGIAALLAMGRTGDPLLRIYAALALLLPGAWCVRWTVWLLREAGEIGPIAFYVPLLFGAAGVSFLAGAAALARQGWRGRRTGAARR